MPFNGRSVLLKRKPVNIPNTAEKVVVRKARISELRKNQAVL